MQLSLALFSPTPAAPPISVGEQLHTLLRKAGVGNLLPVMLHYRDGSKVKARLYLGKDTGKLSALNPRSSRWGRVLHDTDLLVGFTRLNETGGSPKPKEDWEKPLRSFMNFRTAFTRLCHPTLWPHIQKAYSDIDPDSIREQFKAAAAIPPTDPRHSLRFYHLLSQYEDLCNENSFRSMSIGRTMPERERDHLLEAIKAALEAGQCGRWRWRTDYDYSVSLSIDGNGRYVGHFSQEFKNCANGHYWLLINATTAVFYESD